jgi:hypothetical protein
MHIWVNIQYTGTKNGATENTSDHTFIPVKHWAKFTAVSGV